MDVDEILEKYKLEQDTVTRYINAITHSNQSETAEEVDVSRQTINRYKNAFAQMKPEERLLIISTLTQQKLLEQATKWNTIAQAYQVGDKVKLILDKERGPDTHLHGKKAEIIDISFDDASSITDNPKDNFIYTVKLENGEIPEIHFRRQDLKKAQA